MVDTNDNIFSFQGPILHIDILHRECIPFTALPIRGGEPFQALNPRGQNQFPYKLRRLSPDALEEEVRNHESKKAQQRRNLDRHALHTGIHSLGHGPLLGDCGSSGGDVTLTETLVGLILLGVLLGVGLLLLGGDDGGYGVLEG